jgi:hypothetical protein
MWVALEASAEKTSPSVEKPHSFSLSPSALVFLAIDYNCYSQQAAWKTTTLSLPIIHNNLFLDQW